MSNYTIKRPVRTFLPEEYVVTDWETLQPFLIELKDRDINSSADLRKWFQDKSELESVLEEDLAWRYIKMTCDTTDEKLSESYNYFISEINPHIEPIENELSKKAMDSPFLDELKDVEGYDIMIRSLQTSIELFREENIPLNVESSQESQKFGSITGAMTIEVEGEEKTLQQASVYLKDTDRSIREEVYMKIQGRRTEDRSTLNTLYNKLISLRHQISKNAGFDNYRDYKFKALGRFDYTPQDCFDFHDAIASEITPILDDIAIKRKKQLGNPRLRPWDLSVDTEGLKPLVAFKDGNDLLDRSIKCFDRLDTKLGDKLRVMKEMKHLDLESRKGKAPGGYNYPLDEVGVPFIFMNAAGQLRDVVTMVHEGGHAVHSFETKDLELSAFKHTPSEVAELASMSMELMTMHAWDEFFDNEEDLKRAKREHLEQVIETLPWVATIDKFQHWLYTNPTHSDEARIKEWNKIYAQFSSSQVDWEGLENFRDYVWQKQLHLYEVPFYYIEYGMAQLGAIAVYKNYKEDPEKGLELYLNALKLGYKKSIKEIYETAGVKFDFSKAYIKELIDFIKEELKEVE